MDLAPFLFIIAALYGVLYFFDVFFKSCLHYPYLRLLSGTGLEVKPLQLRWTTTSCNRALVRAGVRFSYYLDAWFSAGVYASLALLPVALFILLAALAQDLYHPSQARDASIIEPMIPYLDVPASEVWYYSFGLLFCSLVHELGHALAAVTEDIHIQNIGAQFFFVLPVAFVNLSSDRLFSLNKFKILKILCAGIWHNLLTTLVFYLIYSTLPVLFSPFFSVGNGVVVADLVRTSAVAGSKGFTIGDVVTKINECEVADENGWYDCLGKVKDVTPSFCLHSDIVHELEESIPVQHNEASIDCCGKDSAKNLCFEYVEDEIGILELPQFACLPARQAIESSDLLCNAPEHLCGEMTHCFKPIMHNASNLFRVERAGQSSVIYIGYASDMSKFMQVSSYVPKMFFDGPIFPEVVSKIFSYVTVFSLGLAIINVLPCAFMDGQYIVKIVIPLLFKNIKEENVTIISSITIAFTTVFLIAHLLYILSLKYLLNLFN